MVKLNSEIVINKQYIIQSYEILYINLKLNLSGHIYIMIFYNDNFSIEKNFVLIDDEYLRWSSDDYLYSYINDNIITNISLLYVLFTISISSFSNNHLINVKGIFNILVSL